VLEEFWLVCKAHERERERRGIGDIRRKKERKVAKKGKGWTV